MIVAEHELQLSDDARIALEKLVTNLAKEAKTLREQRAELERDKEILARCGQQADAETSRLSVENEALTQRLSGKTHAIARLESQIETLSDDLNRQAGQGYNVPMIRDFLDQLRSDLEGSIFENENAGCFQRDAVEKDVKYMRRHGQMGGFFPMAIGSPGAVDHDRQRRLEERKAELAALDSLKKRLEFALEAASRPSEVYVIVAGQPEESGWRAMDEVAKNTRPTPGSHAV